MLQDASLITKYGKCHTFLDRGMGGRGVEFEKGSFTQKCVSSQKQKVAEVCFARGLSNWEIGKGKLCNFVLYSAAIYKFQKTHPPSTKPLT